MLDASWPFCRSLPRAAPQASSRNLATVCRTPCPSTRAATDRTTDIVMDSGDGVSHTVPFYEGYVYRSPPCLGSRRPRHHGVHDEDLDRARLLLHDRCDTRDRAKCQGEVVLLAVDFDGEMKAAAGSSDEGQTHELPDCNISSLAASAFVARRCYISPLTASAPVARRCSSTRASSARRPAASMTDLPSVIKYDVGSGAADGGPAEPQGQPCAHDADHVRDGLRRQVQEVPPDAGRRSRHTGIEFLVFEGVFLR